MKDISGQRFSRLVALSYAGEGKWLCRCDCGNMVAPRTDSLTGGNTTSCGCARRKNGSVSNPTYRVWQGIKMRCLNPNDTGYHNYGGRGIKVCERWLDFDTFLHDMGARPNGFEIGRIDNNGDYEPGNCRWETRREQMSNTRRSHMLTWKGKTMTLTEWAKRLGITPNALTDRIRRKLPMDQIMQVGNQGREEVILEWDGRSQTATQWAQELGINRETLYARLYAGWSPERALSTPARKKSKAGSGQRSRLARSSQPSH